MRRPAGPWRLLAPVLVIGGVSLAAQGSTGAPREAARAAPATATAAPPTAAPTARPTATVAPTAGPRLAEIRPNELGRIMVLEYHQFGDEEERWTRTRENFRADLEYLYRNGYRLVGMHDLLENRVRVPAGKSPVVLTFDDSNRSQFQATLTADGRLEVDPRSGLGILEAFIAEHPDFGRAATFCVLPGADPPNNLFGQPELRARKLRYLAERGYEICNHTLWHGILAEMGPKEITRQLALTLKAVREAVPGYDIRVFNPPGGVYPKDLAPVLAGSYEGIDYRHRAILEVSGGPTFAPNHREMDFLHVNRIQAITTWLDHYFGLFEKDPGQRYVSDGDPDRVVFPAGRAGELRAEPGLVEEPSPDPGYRVVRLR